MVQRRASIRRLTRQEFLLLGVGAGAGLTLAGCGGGAPDNTARSGAPGGGGGASDRSSGGVSSPERVTRGGRPLSLGRA